MKKRILTQIVLLLLVAAMCILSSCQGTQGAPGEKGDTGATGNGIADIMTEKVDGGTRVTIKYTDTSKADVVFVIPDGEKGDQGLQGEAGDKGETGEAGRGILKTEIIDGCLWITYTDAPDAPVNVGRVTTEGSSPEGDPTDPPTLDDEPIDMQGYVYKAYVRNFAGGDPDPFQAQTQNGNNDYRCIDFWVSERDSENDMISYSVYNRNQEIEKEYNCRIRQITSEGSQIEFLTVSATNGDGIDLTIIMAKAAAQAATLNLFRNLNDSEHLELSDPSYDQNSIRELSVADKLYFLSGDMNISTMEVLSLSLVNVALYNNLSESFMDIFDGDTLYHNIYNVVTNHKWTVDTMMMMAEMVNIDMDSSDGALSAINNGDFIGYFQYLYSPLWYYYGSGGRITEKNPDGIPAFTVQGGTGEMLYNYLFDVFNRQYGGYWIPQAGSAAVNDNFLTGNVLFTDTTLFNLRTELYRRAEFEYGVLPIPVVKEGMDYCSLVHFNNWAHLWAIPQITGNTEYAERMMQILATSSTDTTMYAYYRTVYLQAAPNNGSREVMDIIQSSMVYDVALMFGWGDIENRINSLASAQYNDYAYIGELVSSAEQEIKDTVDLFRNPTIEW